MENTAKYEYRVCTVDDTEKGVNVTLKRWADDGWELVSGSSHSWQSSERGNPVRYWHTTFVMYWRKPIDQQDENASI